MMQKFEKYLTLRNVLIFGILISLGVTLSEVIRDKQFNFYIFKLSTIDFWNGIVPYGKDWFRHGYDYYLYSPTFNVLFTPFAYMPWHLGEFAWNLMNYLLLALSIYTFPKITDAAKARTLLYLLPILAASQLSFQYNVSVAYMFIFAFSLLERNKGVWAVLIIMISATTKIYGLAELALLLFYPKLWRNISFTALFGIILLALPLVKLNWTELGEYYSAWGTTLMAHKNSRSWQTIYDLHFIEWNGMRYTIMPYIQVGVFAVVALLVLSARKMWSRFDYRVGCLAGVMGWCVLFGNSSEAHTYLLAISGYLLWYWSTERHTRLMKWLYWILLVVLVLVPDDLLCPPSAMRFLFDTIDANKWVFLITWLTMLYYTFRPPTTRSS